jgi:hypothetical protein
VEYERRQVVLLGGGDSKVIGWVNPRLSEEEEAAIREYLMVVSVSFCKLMGR